MAVSIPVLKLQGKCIIFSLRIYLLYIISYLLGTLGRIWYFFKTRISSSIFAYIAVEKPRAAAEKISIKVCTLSTN